MNKRIVTILTVGAVLGFVLTWLNPVNSTALKLVFLVCGFGASAGLIFLSWRSKPLRGVAMALPLAAIIPFLLPGSEIDQAEVRADYLKRLEGFEGTTYVWGGEASRGIDCSGLPRRALRDALWSYGWRHWNGKAFRKWGEHWWFDASAKALSEGYRNYTVPVGVTGKVREMNYQKLVPGDLAVTADGVHLLVYLGEGNWVQADPGEEKVIIQDGRTAKNEWFFAPVAVYRWGKFE